MEKQYSFIDQKELHKELVSLGIKIALKKGELSAMRAELKNLKSFYEGELRALETKKGNDNEKS